MSNTPAWLPYSTAFADYILGCGPAPGLLAEDCFQLGVLAYQAGRYGQGQEWLRMADQLTRQGRHGSEVNHTEVLEHLAWVEFVVSATSFFSLCSLIHLLSFIIADNGTICLRYFFIIIFFVNFYLNIYIIKKRTILTTLIQLTFLHNYNTYKMNLLSKNYCYLH